MIIIYHGGCHDGFCGAWLLSKLYPDATFLPYQYGMYPPTSAVVEGQDVIIVDFCFGVSEMLKLISQAKSLLCFDHHHTVSHDLRDLPQVIFDLEQSGARLVWDYFAEQLEAKFPPNEITAIKSSHWLVDYTEDRDLWRWELSHSREVNAGLRLAKFDFEEWDRLNLTQCRFDGEVLLKYFDQRVESAVKKARMIAIETDFGSYFVPCVTESNPHLISVVGEALSGLPKAPFGMTYFHEADQFVFSLRSRNGFDVSAIAAAFGGGGHKAAAGFKRKTFFDYV